MLLELLAQVGLARSSYFYHRARAVVGEKNLQVRQSITGPNGIGLSGEDCLRPVNVDFNAEVTH